MRAQRSVAPPALIIATRATFGPSFSVTHFDTPRLPEPSFFVSGEMPDDGVLVNRRVLHLRASPQNRPRATTKAKPE
jgi:hypothetical protein